MATTLSMDSLDSSIINTCSYELVSNIGSRIQNTVSNPTLEYISVAYSLAILATESSRFSRTNRSLRMIRKLSDLTDRQLIHRLSLTLAKCKFNARKGLDKVLLLRDNTCLPGDVLSTLSRVMLSNRELWVSSGHQSVVNMFSDDHPLRVYLVDDLASLLLSYTAQCLAVVSGNPDVLTEISAGSRYPHATSGVGRLARVSLAGNVYTSMSGIFGGSVTPMEQVDITNGIYYLDSEVSSGNQDSTSEDDSASSRKPRRGACRLCGTPKFARYSCLVCGFTPR